MAQLVKRQHFVPQTYLKNFSCRQSGEEYYIKALPIQDPTLERIYETNIINACAETHLYTLPGETVEEKMALESFYSNQLEQKYRSIYELLTDSKKLQITNEERKLIISTVVTMFYRTTKWINQHNILMKRVYSYLFDACAQTGKDYFMFEDEKISIKGKTVDEFLKEHKLENKPSQVITQLVTAMRLIDVRLKTDNIFVSKLSDGENEFITSDNPVIIQNMHQKYIMPFDPTNIMKLPLDKKHMLFLMPDAKEALKNVIVRYNTTGVNCVMEKLVSNAEQFEKADRVILGDDSSLNSYLQTKAIAENPIPENELKAIATFEDIQKKLKSLGLV